jgi:hypothetical protein
MQARADRQVRRPGRVLQDDGLPDARYAALRVLNQPLRDATYAFFAMDTSPRERAMYAR